MLPKATAGSMSGWCWEQGQADVFQEWGHDPGWTIAKEVWELQAHPSLRHKSLNTIHKYSFMSFDGVDTIEMIFYMQLTLAWTYIGPAHNDPVTDLQWRSSHTIKSIKMTCL